MAITTKALTPCLWFDSQAEEAAQFYVSVFDRSRIVSTSHYAKAGKETHGRKPGSVMAVAFELEGQPFVALNGGPQFTFSEAISFQVPCETQEEIDRYWDALRAGGGEEGPCGWLKDRFGLSWQVVPEILMEMIADPDEAKVERVTAAFMAMGKFDIAALQAAFDGSGAAPA